MVFPFFVWSDNKYCAIQCTNCQIWENIKTYVCKCLQYKHWVHSNCVEFHPESHSPLPVIIHTTGYLFLERNHINPDFSENKLDLVDIIKQRSNIENNKGTELGVRLDQGP